MRELKALQNNLILIQDNLSDSKIGIYYETVKTSERIEYQSEIAALFEKTPEAEKVKKFTEYRLDFILKKITGFTDDSFSVDGKEVSSDPATDNYYPDWKLFLKENASDILDSVANLLFNLPNQLLKRNSR